jgi:hypothetical protein
MSPDLERARDFTKDNPLFGEWLIAVAVSYGSISYHTKLREERSPGAGRQERMAAVTRAWAVVHGTLEMQKLEPRAGRSKAVFEALVEMAAQIGLLATDGVAGYPYDPAEVM